MSLRDELNEDVHAIFATQWETRDGLVVPEPEDVELGNNGVNLEGTVLYADIDGSTAMVDGNKPHFSAEVYKAYLRCAAKVIKSEDGAITAYDGDRVMAVFIGDHKNTSAVRTALKINYCVRNIINPAIKTQYPSTAFELRQTVGIDTSKLLVARTGVRGANDLVWVGRAANHAAKLTSYSDRSSWITKAVYDVMHGEVKISSDGRNMWEAYTWKDMGGIPIYGSNWTWLV
jgi:class 3 adenylate cyclase